MSTRILIDEPATANWISDLQRAKGRPIPTPVPPTAEQASATVVELGYSPGQSRDRKGRFGSGGGTTIGVSRERPELGGGEVHSYDDLVAARKNPVIAEAERTTTSDLEELDIDVTSQRHVAGVFEGGGEPSLSVKLGPTSTMADIEIAGAYLVRRNEQDSVIVTVGGAEMERLGLTPNATTIRIEGLPTDRASRDRVFEDIQKHTPFASWDEERGTVAVSSFDADIDDGMRANLAGLAATHGGRMTAEPVHERWYFQDEQLRTDAKEYLHPADPSVLRTPDEVRSDHPDDERTAAIPGPRQGGGGPDVGGGAGTGEGAALLGYHPPGPVAEALTPWAYSPGQKRDTKGRFGSGGGAPRTSYDEAGNPLPPTPPEIQDAYERLKAIGVSVRVDDDLSHLRRLDPDLLPEVVSAFESVNVAHPGLFKAVPTELAVTAADPNNYATTKFAPLGPYPKPGQYQEGYATINLVESRWQHGAASELRSDLKRDVEHGWHPEGTGSPGGVIHHEVGHVFDYAVGGPLGASSSYAGPGATREQGYGLAVRDGGGPTASEYSKKSPTERFAEEFAYLASGGEVRNASQRVLQTMMEQYP